MATDGRYTTKRSVIKHAGPPWNPESYSGIICALCVVVSRPRYPQDAPAFLLSGRIGSARPSRHVSSPRTRADQHIHAASTASRPPNVLDVSVSSVLSRPLQSAAILTSFLGRLQRSQSRSTV
jgi:hypothetical protein